jgi:putative peptide modification system cyclase
MNAQLAQESDSALAPPDGAQPFLRTVVITDLCDSTALVERLGDGRASELIRSHDRLLRGLIRQHRGQEIDKTDGFLSLFERPIQAVAFALDYQRGLKVFSQEHAVELKARIGIHVGEVVSWHNEAEDIAKGAKPVEIEGLAKPVAARLMGLALPGQILMSGVAYTLAHRAEGELGATLSRLQWKHHGRFRFKGVAESIPVYEIGEPEIAPFRSPAWSGKAHREVPLWRRPLMLALELLLLAAVLAFPTWYFLRSEPAIAFAERDWVVLGDLRNLTGESRFDESLQQAFMVGLEQSRHVNLVPRLRMRETLALMQQDPDSVSVDRRLGAELALREGARALLLPTLAEVGGRLRFTVEVVDPSSQTTVLSAASDGDRAELTLESVDQVNRQLREHLGEAVAAIEADSVPLERAATPDLDALRAYSLASRANIQNRLPDALALLEQALRIDAQFALALFQRGIILRNASDREGALSALRAALELPERLSRRDRLEAEALLAELEGRPQQTLETWRMLLEIYPDSPGGYSTLGFYQWGLANQLVEAERSLRKGLSGLQVDKGALHYTLGAVLLGQNRIQDALTEFVAYEQTERRFENQFYAAAHASRRDFSEARAALERGARGRLATREPAGHLLEAMLALDVGDFAKVEQQFDLLEQVVTSLPLRQQRAIALWDLGARTLLDRPEAFRARLQRFAESVSSPAEDSTHLADAFDRDRAALMVSWQASRIGDLPLAQAQLASVDAVRIESSHPELRQRLAVAQAALACAGGDAAAGLERLRPLIESGTAFYSAYAARFECEVAAGANDTALLSARWLAEHRGRAYSEIHGDHVLWLWNVGYSTLVLLRAAELAGSIEAEAAQPWLQEFRGRWGMHALPTHLAERVSALETGGP